MKALQKSMCLGEVLLEGFQEGKLYQNLFFYPYLSSGFSGLFLRIYRFTLHGFKLPSSLLTLKVGDIIEISKAA